MAGEHATTPTDPLAPTDLFTHRHIGPNDDEIAEMLRAVGCATLDDLTAQTVPASILMKRPLDLGPERGESETLRTLRAIASKNAVFRSFIGMGYTDTVVPPVIQRNILENPGWYTQYTPYQAEISQGRLEALLNFQTMVSDLTGLPVAGASLLDEATAAAEAMAMCLSAAGGVEGAKRRFFVAHDCHPQTIGVIQTRAEALGVRVEVGDPRAFDYDASDYCGALFQYPTTDGRIEDYWDEIERVHKAGALAVVAADILALTLLTPPGEFGADIAVGSTQRFGVPMGFGGPHAAYMAAKTELARRMPGRIIGVSRDAQGDAAYRMAIQTREQHIRRERATSNICTAQALLAIMAGMYAVYHGPEGLRRIGLRVRTLTLALGAGLRVLGHDIGDGQFFDTLRVRLGKGVKADAVHNAANGAKFNLRAYDDGSVGVTLDEATTEQDVERLLACFAPGSAVGGSSGGASVRDLLRGVSAEYDCVGRTSAFLTHPVFNTHHSETEMLRYIFQLQSRDLSLAHSMIPLGSCTMKLNATSEMLPVTWPEFGAIHPFAPAEQTEGYRELFAQLERWLSEITGFDAVSLQPNAGSQGEFAGLLAIRAYHHSRGDTQRTVCLIPTSAHGTNPASAVVAGFRVVPVRCDERGNVDIDDLRAKADAHKDTLGALMITYPSTHGVFEEGVRDVCKAVHERGGLVYMDGANLNAMVGLCRPADIGADVCHLNLHKTFCIPHGGGGPGMGPIGVTSRLAPFLPGHPVVSPFGAKSNGSKSVGPVSAAPWGSPSILTISWVYIAMMGASGLKKATQVAILNANYMAKRLEGRYDVLFTGRNGRVAHEFIVDCRGFEKSADVKVDDIAKRLMDYGFHAPTMSWPVPGTLMIEPTESEPKAELDRLCDALLAIRAEIAEIEQGALDRANNPLKQAPHTVKILTADEWTRPYPRSRGGYPSGAPWLRERKFWPCVGRIDNAYGDRNLVCTCPPMDEHDA